MKKIKEDYIVNSEAGVTVCIVEYDISSDLGSPRSFFVKGIGKTKLCKPDVFNINTGKRIAFLKAKNVVLRKIRKLTKELIDDHDFMVNYHAQQHNYLLKSNDFAACELAVNIEELNKLKNI